MCGFNMKNDKPAPWLTSVTQVSCASDASLRLSLLTCDGQGTALKSACLDELLTRAKNGSRVADSCLGCTQLRTKYYADGTTLYSCAYHIGITTGECDPQGETHYPQRCDKFNSVRIKE